MQRMEVANVREAVALATKLREQGRYDWFRGQTLERSPYSTGVRLQLREGPEGAARNKERILMFCRWLQNTPQLTHLLQAAYVHEFFAILQHYGIATYYLDFTTDPAVAGFFACDTQAPPSEGHSCIYCLHSRDLMDFWETMSQLDSRKAARIEPVVVDVGNLWRLQAQAGVFLYVNYNWDVDYPMDRIVFPYTGYPPVPTKDRIYPQDRSALEHLLDQYFDIEKAEFTNRYLREFLIKHQGSDDAMVRWESFERGVYAEAFVDASSVLELPSWDESVLEDWHEVPNERYHETVGRNLRLHVGNDHSPDGIGVAIRFGITQSLQSDPGQRSLALQFFLDNARTSLNAEVLQALLTRAWNGMRTLPFTDEELGDCLGRIAVLHAIGFKDVSPDKRKECLMTHFGPMHKVAFGPEDGAGSAGWASIDAMMGCIRSDMRTLLIDAEKSRADAIDKLFAVVYNPRVMFEFEPFKRLFARDVIPTQVIDAREFVLFNVATLSTFGNP